MQYKYNYIFNLDYFHNFHYKEKLELFDQLETLIQSVKNNVDSLKWF